MWFRYQIAVEVQRWAETKTQGHNLVYFTLLDSFAVFNLQLQMISDSILHDGCLGVLLVVTVDVLMSFYLSFYKKAVTLTEQLLTSVLPIARKTSGHSFSSVG